ncbi:hypothetical protein FSP39_007038 [Pinctada imbricata]|uniref:2'-phosphotransferase n=1 Tax=Pinctada imbricata TaxID=66713 RepID=A0AA89BRF7_PINIB|nr:hypothetical protein FSP39_007038 [Pinctada imbricata]
MSAAEFADFRQLVLALRHDQSLPYNSHGWVLTEDLQKRPHFHHFDKDFVRYLDEVIGNPRLEVTPDGRAVRATNGHTIHISDEGLLTPITDASQVPYCVHGTTRDVIKKIKLYGLHRMDRHYIHFASHPDDVKRNSEVLIHLDVAKYLRRNPGKLFYTRSSNIVTMGNKFGYVKPCFFRTMELLY